MLRACTYGSCTESTRVRSWVVKRVLCSTLQQNSFAQVSDICTWCMTDHPVRKLPSICRLSRTITPFSLREATLDFPLFLLHIWCLLTRKSSTWFLKIRLHANLVVACWILSPVTLCQLSGLPSYKDRSQDTKTTY